MELITGTFFLFLCKCKNSIEKGKSNYKENRYVATKKINTLATPNFFVQSLKNIFH